MPFAPPAGVVVQPYRMNERYAAEQWIKHKVFGSGQVIREVGADKIEVRFGVGQKTLIHNKAE